MWIVAVRMVSEGVDIKRLSVLAYLSNATTELFFRQAVGASSAARKRSNRRDKNAYCFIPDDPRLVAHAQKIRRISGPGFSRVPEVKDPADPDVGGPKPRRDIEIIMSSDAHFVRAIHGGEVVDEVLAATARNISATWRSPSPRSSPSSRWACNSVLLAVLKRATTLRTSPKLSKTASTS